MSVSRWTNQGLIGRAYFKVLLSEKIIRWASLSLNEEQTQSRWANYVMVGQK